ncbi:MAG: ABC transporter permease [Clostridia bacterium]|nr:ABC transporter permease [Clostridia bacterium]
MTEERKNYLKKRRKRRLLTATLQAGLLIAFLAIWELVAYLKWVDPFIVSSPSRIVKVVAKLYTQGALFSHLWATLYETILGFLISTIMGTLIAVLLWWSDLLKDVMEPYLITLNALPKIALGPLIIIWVGAGKAAIVTMAVLISVIITVISMLTGFLSVDREKVMLLRSMHATKGQIFAKLIFPANLPTLLSVLKINVGLSWVGTIMGEYLVSREGIGYLIVYGSQVFQLDLVMASTVLLSLLAALMYALVALFEKLVRKKFG